jgi:hypothetical protein
MMMPAPDVVSGTSPIDEPMEHEPTVRSPLHADSAGPADAATVPDDMGAAVIARARRGAAAVDVVVDDARSSIPGWDNLAWIDAFARAAETAREVLRRSTHPVERRVIGARLLRLMPRALLPVEHADRTVSLSLPESVLCRADDDFALRSDDVPRVHPSWTAHLMRKTLLHDVLQPGRHEWLLAPRSLSPKDAVGSALLVRCVGEVDVDPVPLEIKQGGGQTSRRRRLSDGADAGAAELKREVLRGWLRHGGPGGRGLDLRRADDRCLLLTFQETLRERRLDGLLKATASDDPERRSAVISAVVDAAIDAVAFAALDPLACRFVFPAEAVWAEAAIGRLKGLGLGMELMALRAGTPTRDVVWLDAIVDAGFVGGAMSDVAQARAFARLAVSVLSPLGVLPLVGSRCGRGVVLTILEEDRRGPRQRGPLWVEPAGQTSVMPLADAWARGAGRVLPAPTAENAHDVAALPAFLQGFAEAIAERASARGDAAATDADNDDDDGGAFLDDDAPALVDESDIAALPDGDHP